MQRIVYIPVFSLERIERWDLRTPLDIHTTKCSEKCSFLSEFRVTLFFYVLFIFITSLRVPETRYFE